MAFVYILKSLINDRYYIGSTNNLKRRFDEHNNGLSKYTRLTKPFELMFYQEYDTIGKAIKIEVKLKKLKSKLIIDRIIKEKIIKLGV